MCLRRCRGEESDDESRQAQCWRKVGNLLPSFVPFSSTSHCIGVRSPRTICVHLDRTTSSGSRTSKETPKDALGWPNQRGGISFRAGFYQRFCCRARPRQSVRAPDTRTSLESNGTALASARGRGDPDSRLTRRFYSDSGENSCCDPLRVDQSKLAGVRPGMLIDVEHEGLRRQELLSAIAEDPFIEN